MSLLPAVCQALRVPSGPLSTHHLPRASQQPGRCSGLRTPFYGWEIGRSKEYKSYRQRVAGLRLGLAPVSSKLLTQAARVGGRGGKWACLTVSPTHCEPLSPTPAGWLSCSSSAQLTLCDPRKLSHFSGPLSPSALREVGIAAGATAADGQGGV